ncbi:hypothetical protein AMK26_22205 [Streptomyces sp. CB03234]|uniref:DUF6415 family natural product biosynthesis protein n=1 Tax=Streptomyces sp. (strain CB03234) TaxID=1703937 RepID=UPI00093F5416|nr:DUF6415 family natural product biosynthesis protein [Streptomyces sp. CB03234]OKK02384.1 hypothetical protein AMK26_22205 [Streptomyces sp. CB03234]
MTSTAVQHQSERAERIPIRVKDPSVPTHPWTAPLDRAAIERYLSAVREWEPVDWSAVFEDVDALLNGEVSHHAAGSTGRKRAVAPPEYDDADELAQRFRGALMQLVHRGLRDEADKKHPDIAALIEQARVLRSEELPGDPWQALGHLRRLGRVTLQLAQRLDEVGIVKGLIE